MFLVQGQNVGLLNRISPFNSAGIRFVRDMAKWFNAPAFESGILGSIPSISVMKLHEFIKILQVEEEKNPDVEVALSDWSEGYCGPSIYAAEDIGYSETFDKDYKSVRVLVIGW